MEKKNTFRVFSTYVRGKARLARWAGVVVVPLETKVAGTKKKPLYSAEDDEFNISSRPSLDFDAEVTPSYPDVVYSLRLNLDAFFVYRGMIELRREVDDGGFVLVKGQNISSVNAIRIFSPHLLFLMQDRAVVVVSIMESLKEKDLIWRAITLGNYLEGFANRKDKLALLDSAKELKMRTFDENGVVQTCKTYDLKEVIGVEYLNRGRILIAIVDVGLAVLYHVEGTLDVVLVIVKLVSEKEVFKVWSKKLTIPGSKGTDVVLQKRAVFLDRRSSLFYVHFNPYNHFDVLIMMYRRSGFTMVKNWAPEKIFGRLCPNRVIEMKRAEHDQKNGKIILAMRRRTTNTPVPMFDIVFCRLRIAK